MAKCSAQLRSRDQARSISCGLDRVPSFEIGGELQQDRVDAVSRTLSELPVNASSTHGRTIADRA